MYSHEHALARLVRTLGCQLLAADDAHVVGALQVLLACIREALVHVGCRGGTGAGAGRRGDAGANRRATCGPAQRLGFARSGGRPAELALNRASASPRRPAGRQAAGGAPVRRRYRRKSRTRVWKFRNVQYRSRTCGAGALWGRSGRGKVGEARGGVGGSRQVGGGWTRGSSARRAQQAQPLLARCSGQVEETSAAQGPSTVKRQQTTPCAVLPPPGAAGCRRWRRRRRRRRRRRAGAAGRA